MAGILRLKDVSKEYPRSGVAISCTAVSGKPADASPAVTHAAIARLDARASEPPRRMHALPALTHRPAASAVTSGRDS